MSLGARLYVGVMVGLGTAVLAVGAMHPTSHQPMKFLCYLLIAIRPLRGSRSICRESPARCR